MQRKRVRVPADASMTPIVAAPELARVVGWYRTPSATLPNGTMAVQIGVDDAYAVLAADDGGAASRTES